MFSQRLQLFTGKGGVGKSTVVAALALEAARRGARPLIVELGHRATMEGLFERPVGFEPEEVASGVFAMNMDLGEAVADYVARWSRIRSLVRPILESPELRRFFEAAPGVMEVLTLTKIAALVKAKAGRAPRWDPILVDLDATGHALMLLELPRVLDGLVGAGPLRRALNQLSAMLADPDLTRLNLVALPRELVVQETVELYAALRAQRRVELGVLFVNRISGRPLSVDAEEHLHELLALARRVTLQPLVGRIELGREALGRYRDMEAQRERLQRDVPLDLVELGLIPESLSGLGALSWLGAAAGRQLPGRPVEVGS